MSIPDRIKKQAAARGVVIVQSGTEYRAFRRSDIQEHGARADPVSTRDPYHDSIYDSWDDWLESITQFHPSIKIYDPTDES